MATVTVDTPFGFDQNGVDLSTIWYGAEATRTSMTFTVFYSTGFVDEFRGSGVEYDAYGVPTKGTLKSYATFSPEGRIFSVDGIKVAAADIIDASLTYSTKDDIALIKKALAGNDTLKGNAGREVFDGANGNDKLYGFAGNDKLTGGAGNDVLVGGNGADGLWGGVGGDTFVFAALTDSTVAKAGQDTIYDFTKGDHLDLHGLDANTKKAGNQAFSFIGTKAFDGHAGEVRFDKAKSDTYVYADVNGDQKADFGFHLDDAVKLAKADFLL